MCECPHDLVGCATAAIGSCKCIQHTIFERPISRYDGASFMTSPLLSTNGCSVLGSVIT